METFEIYWTDLMPDCQNKLFEFLGGENGNYDVFPIATICGEEAEEQNGRETTASADKKEV